MMNNFFLMTRGRTGSTAIIDELSKCRDICATQELFIKNKAFGKEHLKKTYDLLPPFDVWKLRCSWYERRLAFVFDGRLAFRYLQDAETRAQSQGAECFGFKVLSHHFEQRPFLDALLKQRGYRAIYLTRNIARQVLSGMVAKQRGIYNTKQTYEDSHTYTIDLEEFQKLVEMEAQCVEKDCAYLEKIGFNYIVVSYEDFCTLREEFFKKVFGFLNLQSELPPMSSYSVMIKDLRNTVENYDAVVERAVLLGVPLDA